MQTLFPPTDEYGYIKSRFYTEELGDTLEMLPTTDREEAAFAEFNRIKDTLDNIEISCFYDYLRSYPEIAVDYVEPVWDMGEFYISKDKFDIRKAWNFIKHCSPDYGERELHQLERLNQSYLTSCSNNICTYRDGNTVKHFINH